MATDEMIPVPWSEDPEVNDRVINACIAEAKATGKLLLWDGRPYRLNGVKVGD